MATRIVPFAEGMKVGLGYDRLTGDRLPTPSVQANTISPVTGAGGQQVTIDCTTIQNVETLYKALGISIDAGGSYMGFSGGAKVQYANSCDFSSFSTYVVVRVSVKNATDTMDSPTFSADATKLLVTNNQDRFRERFGDSFIAGILRGGEYFAIYQITGTDQTEKEGVAVQVHAAFNGLLTSAELNAKINKAVSQSKSNLEIRVHVFRQGDVSTADLDLGDIMRTARQFPVGVSGNKAFPYAALLQDYDGLERPNDRFAFVDIKNQQEVLENLAKKRFEFLALRDDIRYVLSHIDDFKNADGTAVDHNRLSNQLDEVIDRINTMQRQASICTRDAQQCEFTKFDTTEFIVPKLVKKPARIGEAIAIDMTLDGVLLAGSWRNADELAQMSEEDKRNALIVELSKHSLQEVPFFQGFDTQTLIGKGAILVFLITAGIRDAFALQGMSDGDQRNALIVENASHTEFTIPVLQGMTDRELVKVGLSWFRK
jgi:hypothetical protein